ncbi:S1 family peptidase [Streptomyces sp. 4N509B]|uniref:S1 family peptidase n=1 Tax=Streptomyces sp. 4N509B TaxID=3457413 RepID=UPI003FCF08F6
MTVRFHRRITMAFALAVAGIVAALAVPAGAATASATEPPATRIVGGTPTTTAEYPFMMQVGFGIVPRCGGTLVAPTKVLTAAHCVETLTPDQLARLVVVGGRDEYQSENGTERPVSEAWVHPDRDRVTRVADVAVLTLAEPMPFATLPIAAATDTHLYEPGTMSRILGWGLTEENGDIPDQLMTAQVPVISDADCEAAYATHTTTYDAPSMVCAAYPEGGVDACNRDSGGPLVIDGVVAGVVSWGRGCARADSPGVYARMTTFSADVMEQITS